MGAHHLVIAGLVLASSVAGAQNAQPVMASVETVAAPVAETTVTSPATVTVPALTPVSLEIRADINSKTAQIGSSFPIRLASPITQNGVILVPAGIEGQGEVVHAAKARAAGKAGELILAARYLDWNGVRIPLRSFKYGPAVGTSRTDEAAAAGAIVAAPIMLFVVGGEVNVPAGTGGIAKTASELVLVEQPR